MRKLPRMPKRETEDLLRELKEIRQTATMERADFGNLLSKEDNPTEFIRKKTDLWRRNWLIAPLDRIIERYESALELQKQK